ncbi:adenylyl-sulfate kinase [Arthrobacter sp. Soil763]|uniref:adenylyl-sulfate kinase n=1 Tax=Arthrobacter sp. Soil763 TaxID=1736402 RepID=UPI0006F5C674|nr:adenylyl-sulfate kinase [Arthrobacter sp. Soil763]KRE78539.1 hypothetical protein ASG71_11805 [Arthrobacter sp. Soil763]
MSLLSGPEPSHVLTGARLDELELLLGGLYGPADGYALPSSVPAEWPWPFTLPVPAAVGKLAVDRGALVITDPDGTPLARLSVIAGQDSGHDTMHVAGRLEALQPAEHPPVRRLRLTRPLTGVGSAQPERAPDPILVAAFDRVPEPAQLAEAMGMAVRHHATLWLVAVAGSQKHGSYTVLELLTVLEHCSEQLSGARTGLLVLPAYEGPSAGPDRTLRDYVLRRLGASILLNYTSDAAAAAGVRPRRRRAANPEPLAGATPAPGTVVLLTGLSGSGKSTIARALVERLQLADGRPVTLLDGDDVRRLLSSGLGFSRQDRELNVRRLGWVASLVSKSGGVAVCAPIAPFESTRQEVREMAESVGSFVLVHVATSLEVCEARDRKGLYARARAGDLGDFTGIGSPYEPPLDADLVLDTGTTPVDAAVDAILAAMSLGAPELAELSQ